MSSKENGKIGSATVDAIVALRETWHTKNHPFFIEFAQGKIGLEPLGRMMAQHYQHVQRVQPSLGLLYYRAPEVAKHYVLDNLLEEEGMVAGPGEGRVPQDHMELILRFCRCAGLTDAEVRATEPLPAWRARSNFYLATVYDEPIGVVFAMQSSQEGQQPAINAERTLPALTGVHGFAPDAPEIVFFAEHEVADSDHAERALGLVRKLIDTPALKERAVEVVEIMVKTRWACMTDVYRTYVQGKRDPLPPGVNKR